MVTITEIQPRIRFHIVISSEIFHTYKLLRNYTKLSHGSLYARARARVCESLKFIARIKRSMEIVILVEEELEFNIY